MSRQKNANPRKSRVPHDLRQEMAQQNPGLAESYEAFCKSMKQYREMEAEIKGLDKPRSRPGMMLRV